MAPQVKQASQFRYLAMPAAKLRALGARNWSSANCDVCDGEVGVSAEALDDCRALAASMGIDEPTIVCNDCIDGTRGAQA